MSAVPNPILIDFERRIKRGPTFAARVLGMPYITYAQYRSGARPFKLFHQRHIEVILLLPREAREVYIEGILNGD